MHCCRPPCRQVTGHNGAVPGTISSYMSACVNIHVPRETDIVLVEYSVNDPYMTKASHAL
eukprot:366012-Chlamydomonas_euryale.AAC.18